MSFPNPLAAVDNYLKAEVIGDDFFLDTLPDDQNYVIVVIADLFYRDMTINWMCVLYNMSAPPAQAPPCTEYGQGAAHIFGQ